MDKEYMNKLVDMFKSWKIVVNEKGNLAYSKDVLQKQKKRKISGVNKDKNKVYSKEGIKLSEKVYFAKLKSGELKLRGGRKNAIKLNEELKAKIESKRIGETRREVYKTLSNIIDNYVQGLEEKANKKSQKAKQVLSVDSDETETGKAEQVQIVDDTENEKLDLQVYSEFTHQNGEDITIEDTKMQEELRAIFESSEDEEKATMHDIPTYTKDRFVKEIFMNAPSEEGAIKDYFREYYEMLDREQQYEVKLLFLGKRGIINKFKAKMLGRKVEEQLIDQIQYRHDVRSTLVDFVARKFGRSLFGKPKYGDG